MKIENIIRREILLDTLSEKEIDDCDWINLSNDEGVETAYKKAKEYEDIFSYYEICDAESEFRYSGDEVSIKGLEVDGGRHYEAKRVAKKIRDGSYISWVFYYGGGKHAQPEIIDWMREEDGASLVNCVETEKLVTVKDFSKIDNL